MQITKYEIFTNKINRDLKIACVSDLHGRRSKSVVEAVRSIAPDVILLVGDILEISVDYMSKRNNNAIDFFRQMVSIAPSYYCFGNHELFFSHAPINLAPVSDPKLREEHIESILKLGVHIVNDTSEEFEDILIGGLVCGYDKDPDVDFVDPDLNFLNDFDKQDGFKILMCHYPHYYEKYLKNTGFDVIVSGHAHGGQWRLFGRGVYAPHQGLFPKYTSGIYDGRFIISRGAVNNSAPIPRLFNPCEVLEINIMKK